MTKDEVLLEILDIEAKLTSLSLRLSDIASDDFQFQIARSERELKRLEERVQKYGLGKVAYTYL